MRLTKSLIVGLLAAVAAGVATVALQLVLSLGAIAVRDVGSGGGMAFVWFDITPAMLIGLIAGAAGFVWHWRRARRAATGT